MLANQTANETAPLFSVIIPLEYHRGRWEQCWHGWQAQTLDKSAYEIILVVPSSFPERDNLIKLAGSACRFVFSDHFHDIGLCAEAATRARGRFLFFTESHCWPEPDVLALCVQALQSNEDLAGFSCRSIPITHNSLSKAEADMYEADIEFGLMIHPWRKVLDQCFVTRREAYEECGGLLPEFGHFSEWVLAARYFECGYKIGYLPEARFHHYYSGSLLEVKHFTLDFVQGEIRYFSCDLHGSGNSLLETPPEWNCQGNFDRDLARSLLRVAIRYFWMSRMRLGRWKESTFLVWRWFWPAICGDGVARLAAAISVFFTYVSVTLASRVAFSIALDARFKKYVAALIRHQRLICIQAENKSRTRSAAHQCECADFNSDSFARDGAGFYPLEIYDGVRFGWSETAAAIRFWAPSGRRLVRIKCLPVRTLSNELELRFFIDGRLVHDSAVIFGYDQITIDLDLSQPKMFKLGWTCRRFKAIGDSRRLGLPILGIKVQGDVCE